MFEKRDALGVLPTGGGKSLVFQLASLFLPKPVVVVSPLISLAEDQTDKLEARRVATTRFDSSLTANEAPQPGFLRSGSPHVRLLAPYSSRRTATMHAALRPCVETCGRDAHIVLRARCPVTGPTLGRPRRGLGTIEKGFGRGTCRAGSGRKANHTAIRPAVRRGAASAPGPAPAFGGPAAVFCARAASAARRKQNGDEAADAGHGVTVIIPPKARMRLWPVGEPIGALESFG